MSWVQPYLFRLLRDLLATVKDLQDWLAGGRRGGSRLRDA